MRPGRTAWRLWVPAMLCVLLLGGSALAAQPRASLPDIEDEVMCLECGTALSLSNAPVAERERAFIRREIALGKTKQQIKDDLVDRFGPAVLAVPQDEGFGLAAYVVPIAVALLALAAVVLVVSRWRGRPKDEERLVELDPLDVRRLEQELAAYDGEPTGNRDP